MLAARSSLSVLPLRSIATSLDIMVTTGVKISVSDANTQNCKVSKFNYKFEFRVLYITDWKKNTFEA